MSTINVDESDMLSSLTSEARRVVMLHSVWIDGWVDAAYDVLDSIVEEMREGGVAPYGPILTADERRYEPMNELEVIAYLEQLISALSKFADSH